MQTAGEAFDACYKSRERPALVAKLTQLHAGITPGEALKELWAGPSPYESPEALKAAINDVITGDVLRFSNLSGFRNLGQ